ncbi:MAG: cytochrome c biogenesis protein ResB [Deltaproteobacteria bacterium]|nr:MAG: cytochrome c biogenesis protein ResB [Deltaproteobacteria bacterium]
MDENNRKGSFDMSKKSSESFFEKVWKFFASLRLAIPVLIILAVASIFGTIIEQNKPLEHYRRFYSESTIKILSKLGLFDMYHSWWFLLLLVLFAINLTCCTVDRLPNVFKVVRNPKRTLDEGMERSLSLVHRWRKKGKVEELREKFASALSQAFAKPVETYNSDVLHLYAERGAFSRFGVYITHVSILIVLVGAIIGNIWGFKGYVNIVEGDQISRVQTRGSKGIVDLGFAVRCNDFRIEYYPNGTPKEYISDLSVIEGGKEVLRKTIEVNDPLRYKGIWFYQSSYGTAGATNITVDVRKKEDGSLIKRLTLLPNQKVKVEGVGTISAVDFDPNLQGFGPALRVRVEGESGQPLSFWIFKNFPDFDKRRGQPFYLVFSGIDEIYYTGLQVAKDPGVNIVWVGCVFMVLGILVAFFGSHRRVWLKLVPQEGGRVEVVLAGAANRNRLAFEKTFQRLKEELSKV